MLNQKIKIWILVVLNSQQYCVAKLKRFEYFQAKLGGLESTDSKATMRVEDSSVETEDTSLREAAGASKTLSDVLVEVHKEGKYVLKK